MGEDLGESLNSYVVITSDEEQYGGGEEEEGGGRKKPEVNNNRSMSQDSSKAQGPSSIPRPPPSWSRQRRNSAPPMGFNLFKRVLLTELSIRSEAVCRMVARFDDEEDTGFVFRAKAPEIRIRPKSLVYYEEPSKWDWR